MLVRRAGRSAGRGHRRCAGPFGAAAHADQAARDAVAAAPAGGSLGGHREARAAPVARSAPPGYRRCAAGGLAQGGRALGVAPDGCVPWCISSFTSVTAARTCRGDSTTIPHALKRVPSYVFFGDYHLEPCQSRAEDNHPRERLGVRNLAAACGTCFWSYTGTGQQIAHAPCIIRSAPLVSGALGELLWQNDLAPCTKNYGYPEYLSLPHYSERSTSTRM